VACTAGAIAFPWYPFPVNPFAGVTEASFLLAILFLIAAGWVSLGRSSQRRNGIMMLVLALLDSAQASLQFITWGPWAFVGTVLSPLGVVLLGWLLMRWPRQHLQTRVQVYSLRAALVLVPLTTVAWCIVWDPRWVGFPASAWWPTLVRDEDLGNWLYDGSDCVEGLLLVLFVVLIAVKLRQATRPGRLELAPVAIAGTALAAFAALSVIDDLSGVNASDVVLLLQNLSVLAIPLSFLMAVAVRRVQRALAVESLLDPHRLATVDAVGRALGRILGDRQLTLATWSLQHDQYLLGDGTAAPGDSAGRHVVYVASPVDGTPLARIGVDPRLAGQTDFLEAVLRAAGTALDNARLQAELRAGQRQAEESAQQLDHAQAVQRRLTRLMPGGLAERLSRDPDAFATAELLTVTVLMSDIRGYTGLAETAPPAQLAAQLNEHRQAMNDAVLAQGGTVMQYVGDLVMAVFGAPEPLESHQQRALTAATLMHAAQAALNAAWAEQGRPSFGLGIGLSTGQVAAALLGSQERVEYTMVGDTVNLAYRLCDAARPAGSTVASAATINGAGPVAGMDGVDGYELLPALPVKGRAATVAAYRRAPEGA
jgi:class 3 adenylate cyclase